MIKKVFTVLTIIFVLYAAFWCFMMYTRLDVARAYLATQKRVQCAETNKVAWDQPFDVKTCTPCEVRSRPYMWDTESVYIKEALGDTCVMQIQNGTEGGFAYYKCVVPRSQGSLQADALFESPAPSGSIAALNGSSVSSDRCTLIASGNGFSASTFYNYGPMTQKILLWVVRLIDGPHTS